MFWVIFLSFSWTILYFALKKIFHPSRTAVLLLTFWPLAVPWAWAVFPVVSLGEFESVRLVSPSGKKNREKYLWKCQKNWMLKEINEYKCVFCWIEITADDKNLYKTVEIKWKNEHLKAQIWNFTSLFLPYSDAASGWPASRSGGGVPLAEHAGRGRGRRWGRCMLCELWLARCFLCRRAEKSALKHRQWLFWLLL